MATDSASDSPSDVFQSTPDSLGPKRAVPAKYKVSLDEVLFFLKSGRKDPPSFVGLDKETRKKRLHTLSEFARNFEYEGRPNYHSAYFRPK